MKRKHGKLNVTEFQLKNKVFVDQINRRRSRCVHTSSEAATPVTSLFIYFLQETYNWKLNPCGLTKSFLHYKPDIDCRAAV
jgi:hypothetical protein